MKLEIILGIFAFFLLGAIPFAANGQSADIANHVVINEADINPPGDDSKSISEWVEIFNPTNEEVYIGDWEIASTTVLKKTLTIHVGTSIKPGQFLTYSYQSSWFTDVAEKIELRDETGTVIDETPIINDLNNDFSSWQRVYDGFDTNTSDDWTFETSSAGSTNGKLVIEEAEEGVLVTVSTEKSSYIFGETATISGTVSKQVFVEQPTFSQATIDVIISGPNYYDTLTIYPDLNLEYEISLKLQKVLRIYGGVYDVSVSYAGAIAQTQFSVGDEVIETILKEAGALVISTDKESYIPGETAIIFAETSEIIGFEGLKFTVTNPDGIQIFDGTLFPSIGSVNTGIRGADFIEYGDAQFITNLFMDTVSPSYGIHTIGAEYGTQTAIATFELSEDVKEDTIISLRTDKPVYKPGDVVVISGRLNNLYVPQLNLNVDQTQVSALTGIRSQSYGSGESTRIVKIKDGVTLEGDSSFTYQFTIPNNANSLGEFRVTVSENVGKAVVFFKVVENPETFDPREVERLSISTDKIIYEIGEKMTIIGRVGQLQESSQYYNPQVDILIVDETGKRTTINVDRKSVTGNKDATADLFYTGIPDAAGNFIIEETISRHLFTAQEYRVVARYADGKFFDSTDFKVVDPLDIGKRFELQLNKEVFGLGETVLLDGIVPGVGQHDGVKITVFRPDGTDSQSGVLIDNSRFSWSWVTPITEKTINVINERSVQSFQTNYGVYQIVVAGKSGSESIFFKVSPNPEQDTLEIEPLSVTTDKAVYVAGDTLTVIGSAIKREQGMEGLVVPQRASISIQLADFPYTPLQSGSAQVYLDTGGNFQSKFSLPLTVVGEGKYVVKVKYGDLRSETFFLVDNDFFIDADTPLVILLSTDKQEYGLGETVQVTGTPSKFVILKKISITVVHEDELQVTCGSFICGLPGATSSIIPDASATFTYEYNIPSTDDSIGVYEIIIDAQFGTFSKSFLVTEQATLLKELGDQLEKGKRTTEKVNRIPGTI
ncbi:MAG: lamin tail domain-containing protein, partial [Thaumarchaeota archaeon]|nr:lamin tail domain-containing protein [Nitrososphaerota archaeon]